MQFRKMLGGGQVRVNTRSFQNDMRTFKTKDDVLTLLIHLGYLAYDSVEKEAFIPLPYPFFLDIINRKIV